MAGKVSVKRVLIDYESDGKSITIQLNPNEVGSIVFNPDDLKRAQDKQNELAAISGSGVRPVREILFKKFGPAPDGAGVIAIGDTVDSTNLTEDGPNLWWHTNTCTWFHPADELQT